MLGDYGLKAVSMTPEQSCPKPFHMAAKRPEIRKKAKRYFQHMIRAASELDCDRVLITSGWQFFSEDREKLKREAEAARRLGAAAEFVNTVPLPFAAGGAVKVKGQAQFHPLKFLKG